MEEESTEFIERHILAGLITSTEFLREMVGDNFDSELLIATPARNVARWCLDHYGKHSQAPGQSDFELLFRTKTKRMPKAEVSDMESLMAELSREYSKKSPSLDYLLTSTREYVEVRLVAILGEKLLTSVEKPDGLKAAQEALTEYSVRGSKRKKSNAVDVFSREAVAKAFITLPTPLIRFGRALDEFWGHQFVRDSFVAFLAPEKRGKSFSLQEVAVRATSEGLNAAIFQAGDMSESQALMRLYMRVSDKPAPYKSSIQREEESDEVGPSFYWEPQLDCVLNQIGECPYSSSKQQSSKQEPLMIRSTYTEKKDNGELVVELKEAVEGREERWENCHNCRDKIQPTVCFRKKKVDRVLDEREVRNGIHKWKRHSKGRLFMATYANETLTVSEITSRLDEWEKTENLKIPVVIIDYADIMASDADYSKLEPRHQINKTWQRLRALSEKRNCLVVTATQAAASAYDKNTLRMSDFSEDKRKYSHVTALYGLNQTAQEKKMGIMRINPIVVRDSDYDSSKTVTVLQCLAVGKPMLTSF